VAKTCFRAGRVLCVLAIACLSLVLAPMARATVTPFTWTGEATESNWSAAMNWEGETAPSSPGPVALDFPRIPSCTGACYKSTNDVNGLDVESIGIDDGDEYELEGDVITLGGGGLTVSPAGGASGPSGDFIGLPIELGASQTWTVTGRSGGGVGENGVFVGGDLTGVGEELTTNISNGSAVYLANDTEAGPVAFEGTDVGEPGVLNGFVGLLGGDVDSADEGSVSLSHILFLGYGAVGSLDTSDAELGVGSGHSTGGIQAQSVALDAASEVEFDISGPGTIADTDYSQLSSAGTIALGGASLGVFVSPTSGTSCPTLAPGQTYTFVSTTGTLSGSFANAPEGAEIPVVYAKSCATHPSAHLLIAYHRSGGGAQTVTGIVTDGSPLSEEHINPYVREEDGVEWGAISGALAVAEANAAKRKAREEAEARARALAEASLGEVSLASTGIAVQGDGMAFVKLGCKGGESCGGKLTLSAQATSKAKGKKKRTITIGTAGFSIAAGKTATVKVKLNAAGRGLLKANHERLVANLTIMKLTPAPEHIQTASVRLSGERPRGKTKK
jgi:hypothetical protein